MPFSIHLHKKVISALEIEPAAFHSSVNVLVSEMVRHVPFVLVEMFVGILVFPDSTTIAKMRTTKHSLCHWMNVRSLQIATMSGHVDALQLFQNVPYAKMDPALQNAIYMNNDSFFIFHTSKLSEIMILGVRALALFWVFASGFCRLCKL